jgi:pyruvate dehydrogenase kinase 2/3/4
MRATGVKHNGAPCLPSVCATISAGGDDVSIRISDQGERCQQNLDAQYELMFAGGGLMNPQINSPSDLLSFSHVRNAARMEDSRLGALRTASSWPHGVRATVDEQVGRWQQSRQPQQQSAMPSELDGKDPEVVAGIEPHPRIGIGLPMSNIFAT